MLRSILLGLLVISGASACKSGEGDAPVVEPGKAVGKVLEITGKVTATRGTVTRDLDASSTVSGDDVITTAGDGRITILLAHNNAKWDLGPNKHEQVSTSMAWRLAKVDAPAGKVDETTTAAGRHAERAAANGESAAAPAAPAAATETGRATATDPAPGPRALAQPPVADEPAPPPPPPPPPPKPKKAFTGAPGGPGGGSTGPTDASRKGARDSKESVGQTTANASLGEGDGVPNRRGPMQIESAKAPDTGEKDVQDKGGGSSPLQAAVQKERSALHACVVASGKDRLAITVHFAKGKATIELADGSPADKACVAKVAARIKLTVDAADYSTVITK